MQAPLFLITSLETNTQGCLPRSAAHLKQVSMRRETVFQVTVTPSDLERFRVQQQATGTWGHSTILHAAFLPAALRWLHGLRLNPATTSLKKK